MRLVTDPAGTRRIAICVSDAAYDVLNRARVAASIRDGRERTLSGFVGALVETLAQDCDPVGQTRQALEADALARRAGEEDGA